MINITIYFVILINFKKIIEVKTFLEHSNSIKKKNSSLFFFKYLNFLKLFYNYYNQYYYYNSYKIILNRLISINNVNNYYNFLNYNKVKTLTKTNVIQKNVYKKVLITKNNFFLQFNFKIQELNFLISSKLLIKKLSYNFFINFTVNSKINKNYKLDIISHNKQNLLNKNSFKFSYLVLTLNLKLHKNILNYLFSTINISFNFFKYHLKFSNLIFYFKVKLSNKKLNLKFFKNYLIFLIDYFSKNSLKWTSNKYINNFYNILYCNNLSSINIYKNSYFNNKSNLFSNYYPILISNNKQLSCFFNNVKFNRNLNYLYLLNKLFLNFFESYFKKNIYLKTINNKIKEIKNVYLDVLINEYKNYNPQYFKNFLFSDFLKILWYSFLMKDLKMLSDWITKFMETLNFKNHKKFINFFQNFVNKYSGLFIDVLRIKGFFFDIRGKVGVTGSSKKRHLCFKFGSLNKSSKNLKINYNHNLVRTYSGVLGLTYIICY